MNTNDFQTVTGFTSIKPNLKYYKYDKTKNLVIKPRGTYRDGVYSVHQIDNVGNFDIVLGYSKNKASCEKFIEMLNSQNYTQENSQKQVKLTPKQERLKRAIKPLVETILREESGPITKQFIPFSEQMPDTNKMIFLIDKRGDYCVGFYNSKTDKLEAVGTPFRTYENIGIANFTHWAK